jgi:predicted acylesterase/phospholipase RssA
METDIEYLVFSPGGIYGFAHVGVLQTLEREWAKAGKNLHHSLRGAAGSSIGAAMALAVVLGYNGRELEQFASEQLEELSAHLNEANLMNLYNRMGMLPPTAVQLFIERMVARKLGRHDHTFAEFAEEIPVSGRRLVIGVHNADLMRDELLSAETTPDMSVTKACTMSCMIPVIFEPIAHNGCLYVDGGLSNSLPYDLFDPDRTLAVYLQKVPGQHRLLDLDRNRFLMFIAVLIDAYEGATRLKLQYTQPREVIRVRIAIRSMSSLFANKAEQRAMVAIGELSTLLHITPDLLPGVVGVLEVASRVWLARAAGTSAEAAQPRTSPLGLLPLPIVPT